MAKNLDETKKAVHEFMSNNKGGGWSDPMARMPLFKGQTVTFTGDTELQHSNNPDIPNWLAFMTTDGVPVGLRQLFRRGNGLSFGEANTPEKAVDLFIDACATLENGLSLKLADVKKVESSSRDGKNTYYIFEPFDFAAITTEKVEDAKETVDVSDNKDEKSK